MQRTTPPAYCQSPPSRAAWLRDALSQGPLPAVEVLRLGHEAGYSQTQLSRAKMEAGVVSTRRGATIYWGLPEGPGESLRHGPFLRAVEQAIGEGQHLLDSAALTRDQRHDAAALVHFMQTYLGLLANS
jgi:hypothetical protein